MTEKKEPCLPTITGVVLTSKGGERLIERCLASLAFCDTILVVDSGSKDNTLGIAAQHGAVILEREWEGFAPQFIFAHGKVETDWFFVLDQDEICPPKLGALVKQAITRATAALNEGKEAPVGFTVGRKSWYFDRFLMHSGWYPDHILRVYKKGCVEFYQDAHIHYRALGKTEHLGGPGSEIIHYPYTSFFHQLEKLNVYAQQGADAMRASGKKGGICKGLSHGAGRFIRLYLLKKGFLDGRAGFLAAAHGAFYAFIKYARVAEANWGEPFDHT